jgi:hypothetical protein
VPTQGVSFPSILTSSSPCRLPSGAYRRTVCRLGTLCRCLAPLCWARFPCSFSLSLGWARDCLRIVRDVRGWSLRGGRELGWGLSFQCSDARECPVLPLCGRLCRAKLFPVTVSPVATEVSAAISMRSWGAFSPPSRAAHAPPCSTTAAHVAGRSGKALRGRVLL